VEFEGSFVLTCDAGYAPEGRDTATCAAVDTTAESAVTAGAALTCKIQDCGEAPTVTGNGNVDCDGTTYGSTCKVMCDAGHHYVPSATQAPDGELTCVADGAQVKWDTPDNFKCEPVVCAVELADFTKATTRTTGAISYDGTLDLTCDMGYGTTASVRTSQAFQATCKTDENYASFFDANNQECVPLDCEALSTISGGFALKLDSGYDEDTQLTSGDTSEFACTSGKAVDASYKFVTCSEGTLYMCEEQACDSMMDVSTACTAANAETTEQQILKSSVSFELDIGRRLALDDRRLSTGEVDEATVSAAFKKAMAAQLEVSAGDVVVENTVLTTVGSKVNVDIAFYVVVATGTDLATFKDSFNTIAGGGADLSTFTAAFQDEMADAGVDVTVGEVTVTPPEEGTIIVAKVPEEKEKEPESGGGGAVVIVVVVLVVLAVVGLVVWKFVLKK
jgi:hypothetical protein